MRIEDNLLNLIIVDDEPRVVKALEREIRARYPESKFGVRSYEDPFVCIDDLQRTPGDAFLVISDLRMPAMNGAELLERVKKVDPDIQTVLLTAFSDMDDIRKAISSKIRGLMPKPWSQAGLYAEIDGALAEFRLRKENSYLKEELTRQLATAGQFQRAILAASDPLPEYPSVSIEYRPLARLSCGGDYYDAFPIGDGRLVLLLGDVTGHGIQPALVTLMMKTLVQASRRWAGSSFSPAAFLETLNDKVCSSLAASPETLVAFAAAVVDPSAGTVTVANAGLPDVVLGSGGRIKQAFALDGPALGFEPGTTYSEETVRFESGDRLVMSSDGLFDVDRIGGAVPPDEATSQIAEAAGANLDAAGICDAFRCHHPNTAFSDDVTVIVAAL